MSFSSRDLTKAVRTGQPANSPVFAQALMDSRRERMDKSRQQYGESVLRNNTGGRSCTERLEGRAAVAKLTEFHIHHARPDCAILEIYPAGRDQLPVWAVRDIHGGVRWIMSVMEPGKSANIWRA